MAWDISAATISLLTPHVALKFRVIPLGQQADGVIKLLTDELLSPKDRQIRERAVAFFIRKPVELHTVDEFTAEDADSFFKDTLDTYYSCEYPVAISTPVSVNLLNVLLFDPDPQSRLQGAKRLEIAGFTVQAGHSMESVLRMLTEPCWSFEYIVLPDSLNSTQRRAYECKFKLLSNTRVVTLTALLASECVAQEGLCCNWEAQQTIPLKGD